MVTTLKSTDITEADMNKIINFWKKSIVRCGQC